MNYADGMFFYFLCWLILLVVLWLREVRRERRNSWELTNSKLFHCDHCHLSYIINDEGSWSRCPRCNSVVICRKKNKLE